MLVLVLTVAISRERGEKKLDLDSRQDFIFNYFELHLAILHYLDQGFIGFALKAMHKTVVNSSGEEANMDITSSKEREIVIDIDRFIDTSREVGSPVLADEKIGNAVSFNVCGMPESVDEVVRGEVVDEISPEIGKNSKRAKGKPKKSPKPPRPPRALLSLDAADQKLIKELAELAMIKRAKIERMKALRKMRAAKASSSSTSSGGNLMAILFTVIFFVVIVLQGCHSSHGNKSSVPVLGSLESSTVGQQNLFASGVPLTSIESPNIIQPVPGSDTAKAEAEKSGH